MESQRKVTIRDRLAAAARAVTIGSLASTFGTALVYRSLIRKKQNPEPDLKKDAIDWQRLGSELVQACGPIISQAVGVRVQMPHDEDSLCDDPDCGPCRAHEAREAQGRTTH